MRLKLRLDLDRLAVDTFATTAPTAEKGTVFGEQNTRYTNCTCYTICYTCETYCDQVTCDHTYCLQLTCGHTCASCEESCYGTCEGYSCDPTCDFTCICV